MNRFKNYFIEDQNRLGRGGFGEVFKVNIYNLSRTYHSEYARKYFSPSKENNQTQIREIADLRKRFIVEIKTQCYLSTKNYNSIAPIVLYCLEGEHPFFVMELADCNLSEMIRNGLSDSDKIDAIEQIIRGVGIIHENRYLHRDLKPENILKYSDGKYKISDFGLVKDLNSLRAEVKTQFQPNGIGSDGYRAPEITENGKFSEQSDIFALGKIIDDIYEGNAPHEMRNLIAKCMHYFPESRYSSVEQLLNDFYGTIYPSAESA